MCGSCTSMLFVVALTQDVLSKQNPARDWPEKAIPQSPSLDFSAWACLTVDLNILHLSTPTTNQLNLKIQKNSRATSPISQVVFLSSLAILFQATPNEQTTPVARPPATSNQQTWGN